ncbi:MAG: phytoene/squalene synthase family protein [Acidimicrobiia bacterium]
MTTLEESYARCRQLNKAHGVTFYALTFLLPRVKRHHVHALYGFCRHADDTVDELGSVSVEKRARALSDYGDRFFADLDRGDSDDLVLKAVVHTVTAFDLNPDCFRRYLRSMSMDLTVTDYETFDDLLDYMDGSAAAIAEMMLPILEPTSGEAVTHARDLAVGFQLTNLLRDVAPDLDRQRVYVPQEDLERFDADPWLRRTTPEWRALMKFEIARTRGYFVSADRGLPLLSAASARCIRAVSMLQREVLEQIDSADGDVFSGRARVPTARKAFVVGRGLIGR